MAVNGVQAVEGANDTSNGRACRYRNRQEAAGRKSLEVSSETESDGDSETPRVTTRKAWSDYCSNKGRSSQSEDDMSGRVLLMLSACLREVCGRCSLGIGKLCTQTYPNSQGNLKFIWRKGSLNYLLNS